MAVEEGEMGGGLLSNLTPRQRAVAIASMVIIVALVITLVALLGQRTTDDKYVVILKDLPHKSIGEAIELLKEEKIPYEIRSEGTALAVERAKKEQAIISLSMQGLPKDGKVGFEIFGDKAGGFISTDFEKKVALRRAVNGELSRIIGRMEGVDNAEVMVVSPEPQLFQEQELPTTASVLIKFKSAGGFKQEQVDAITFLIASSVQGLKPNNVTVTDTDGHVLAAGQGSAESDSSKYSKQIAQQLEIKKEMEGRAEAKIVDLLEKIVGPGHVKARVEDEINFDAIQQRMRTMTPIYDKKGEKPLPVAVKTLKETSEEPKFSEGSGGVPGADGNTGDQANTAAVNQSKTGLAKQSKESEQQTLNFDNKEELATFAAGKIIKQSIAVTYQYGEAKMTGEEANAEEGGIKKLTNDQIQELVKNSVGYTQERGDTISVTEVVFDDSVQKLLAEQMKKQEDAKKMVPWWVALIVGIGTLVVGAGVGGALLGKKVPPPEAAGGFGAPMGGGDYAAIPGSPMGGAIPAPGGAPVVAAPQDKLEVSRAPITPPPDNPFGFLYGVQPETVANLLSSERLPTLVAVLAQLDPSQADEVINLLNPEIQSEVRSRLANNPILPPMTQKMVSQSLKKRLQSLITSAA